MKNRRGFLWLTTGILLALLAGLMTFQIVNELDTASKAAENRDVSTVSVIVAVADIAPYVAINTGMVTLMNVPATMAPQEHVANIEDVIGKMTLAPVTLGEILVAPRLVDPTDPDAPVLYTMNQNEVLVAVPSITLAGQLGLLSVGQHIDIAYTGEFSQQDENDEVSNRTTPTTFLSLQNLEIKGMLSRQISADGITSSPDAILLAVAPQEALILKYLIDAGAPMDILLRSPGNNARMTVAPVDEQFLLDYFQLDLDTSFDFAAGRGIRTLEDGTVQNNGDVSQIQSLIQGQSDAPATTSGN